MTQHRFPLAVRMLAALTLSVLAAISASAIASQNTQGGAPASAGATEPLATMDFITVAADGSPVVDLKAEEVTLRIDGRVRPITSLRLVQIPGVPAAPALSAGPALTVAQAFGTNAGPDLGRAIVIVVDDESVPIGREPALRTALGDFLKRLSVRDRVALVTVPHGGIKADLTTDHDRVGRAIREIAGASVDRPQISGVTGADDRACRTRDTLQALAGTLDSLRGGGQPATVVFLSTSLAGPSAMQMAQRGAGAPDMGVCLLRQEDFEKVRVAAAGARAQFYVIHPDFSAEAARSGIESLRGITGAPLFHMTTTEEPGLARVARETTSYYVAAFEMQRGERAGTHEASVRVARRDVTVRHRPDVLLERPTAGSVAGGSAAVRLSSRDMTRTTGFFGDLGLRAAAYSSRNDGTDGFKVIGLFEAADGATLSEAAAALFAENGRLIAEWTSKELSGRATAFAMTAPSAGRYRLRVAAVDALGRRGAVDYDTVVELTRTGPLRMSSLVLGSMRDTGFVPRLQFTTESVAVGYFELYGGVPGGKVSIVFEIAQTPDGPPLLQVPVAATATNQTDRTVITGSLAIGALPPGDYVVRAIVQVEGQPAGQVLRTLRKS